jgi:hypothetical protein
MRRRIFAIAWIAGATVPLLLATVFVFGCCVLPFHQTVHKLMPLCETAADMMRGEHDHDATPPAPLKKIRATTSVPGSSFIVPRSSFATTSPAAATHYRSFISLGATRCDRDVGWHVLVATFLI